jgi:hypothetical protein
MDVTFAGAVTGWVKVPAAGSAGAGGAGAEHERSHPAFHGAQVAQLVEQRTENPRVGGSIPPLGTITSFWR